MLHKKSHNFRNLAFDLKILATSVRIKIPLIEIMHTSGNIYNYWQVVFKQ
jgi:hypothetical protein